MITAWTQHLKSDDEKSEFNRSLFGSKYVLDRLKDILLEKNVSLDNSETTLEAYDTPNWDFKQAHKNGYRSCLKSILKLIDLDQQELINERKPIRP